MIEQLHKKLTICGSNYTRNLKLWVQFVKKMSLVEMIEQLHKKLKICGSNVPMEQKELYS